LLTYSTFTYEPERKCHFLTPGRNCMTRCRALQDFSDTSQVWLHKNKSQLTFVMTGAKNDVSVHTHALCTI
jgi:hypothetical protein